MFGFKKGKSTIDAILLLKMIQELAKESGKPIFFVSIDLTKAYDKADRGKVLKAIRNWAPREAHIQKFLWKGFRTDLYYGRTKVGRIQTDFGLPQGAPSSPTNFNACMREVMKRLQYEDHGIQVGIYKIPGAAFADDVWVCGYSWEETEAALRSMIESFAGFGLEINFEKSFCW